MSLSAGADVFRVADAFGQSHADLPGTFQVQNDIGQSRVAWLQHLRQLHRCCKHAWQILRWLSVTQRS